MIISLKIAKQLESILPKFEIPKIVFALRQDTLIWDAVSDLKFLDYLINWEGSDQAEFWIPSKIGLIYYFYDKNIPAGELTCENLLDHMGIDEQIIFKHLVHNSKNAETIIDGITSACIVAQQYQNNPNWNDNF